MSHFFQINENPVITITGSDQIYHPVTIRLAIIAETNAYPRRSFVLDEIVL